MKKTENYQLNQWDAGDRVLRTDFNGDNEKIETALTALQNKPVLEKLKEFTVPKRFTGTAVFDMDVSDINWGAYQYVYADFDLKGHGYLLIYPNGNPKDAYSHGYVTSTSYKSLAGMIGCGTGMMRAEFQIFAKKQNHIQTVCPYKGLTGRADCPYQALRTLHLIPDDTSYYMDPGSTITFWGVR